VARPQRFLEKLRAPAPAGESQRVELALSTARLLLAACALLAHFIAPLPAGHLIHRLPGLLLLYLLYSLLAAGWVRLRQPSSNFLLAVQGSDLLWAALVALSVGQSGRVAGFVFFAFALAAAASRWGLTAALASAGIALVLLFAGETLLSSAFQSAPELFSKESNWRVLLARAAYLLPLAFLFGYLAQVEKKLRAETSQAKAMDRALVARELHDGAIQSLIGMEVQVEVLRRQAAEQSLPREKELARIQELLRREALNLRELMQQMKPLDIGPEQLLDFLAESADRFWRETGISASFVSNLDRVLLPPRVCQEVARIAQEALVNVRKHSGARNVVLRFGSQNGSWKLVVDDDGRGFDFVGRFTQTQLDAARKGPVIIKERVRSVGGELTIESTKGKGARLEITFPKQDAMTTRRS